MSANIESNNLETVFKCDRCDKVFSAKRNLRKHEVNFHGRTPNGFKCIRCETVITNVSSYANHLNSEHRILMEFHSLTFDSIQDFDTWKTKIEEENTCFYKLSSSSSDGRKYFDCNRSGTYLAPEDRERYLKIQGSRKIGGRCPSTIQLNMENEKVLIRYQAKHVGHTLDLKHIQLSSNQREELASYLTLGMSRQVILNKIRSTWTDETKRIHLTSVKDLTNISSSFNLKSHVNRDSNDLVSVESWISEMKETEQDPIIHYQQPDDDGSSSFMLVISTIGQRFMLEKYGGNVIAMDSTHGTNDYDFQLTTIMVVDENR
ncbi:uncharacterized protein LOC128390789 [Panonychus citri]|uniref:uncharacterized protein LOC128388824 n=1 Tax=Panonychus citri TaxID=50023 RepID=UPI002307C0E6|nr:uncharacterized protein LOC128388824 [Panonychus citri]XP_053206523.1 uncharacterized protein LOC128390789 [Panonychus citri]